jgi:hypothetical protein
MISGRSKQVVGSGNMWLEGPNTWLGLKQMVQRRDTWLRRVETCDWRVGIHGQRWKYVVEGRNKWLGVKICGWGRNQQLGVEIHDWRVQIHGLRLKQVVRGKTHG